MLLIIEAAWVVGVFPIFLLTGQARRECCAYLTTVASESGRRQECPNSAWVISPPDFLSWCP